MCQNGAGNEKLILIQYNMQFIILFLLKIMKYILVPTSPIKSTIRKIRRLASAELWATSKHEVVGC